MSPWWYGGVFVLDDVRDAAAAAVAVGRHRHGLRANQGVDGARLRH